MTTITTADAFARLELQRAPVVAAHCGVDIARQIEAMIAEHRAAQDAGRWAEAEQIRLSAYELIDAALERRERLQAIHRPGNPQPPVEPQPIPLPEPEPTDRKEVVYDPESGKYAMFLDGELVGYARSFYEAEVTLDQLIHEQMTHVAAALQSN